MIDRATTRLRLLARNITPLHVVVALVAVIGGVVLVASAVVLARDGFTLDHHFAVVAAATLFCDATWVNMRIRHHIESYTWAELTLTLALAWLAPAAIVATALLLGLSYAVGGRSPLKVLFNTTSYAFGMALAAATTRALTTPSWAHPGPSAGAIAAGVLVFSLWNGATVNAAIAYSQDLPFRPVFMRGLGLRTLVAAGNLLLGLGVLAVAHYEPAALWAFPAVLGGAYAAYHSYLRVVQDRAVWRQLEATGQEINRLDERQIADVTLARAIALFDADEVELVLYPPDGVGPSRVYLTNAAGSATVVRTDIDLRDQSFTVTTYRGDGRHARETCVVVPLIQRGSRMGALRVRFFGAIKLSNRERQLLNTFASTVATSVENARLYANVQAEAVRHETASRHDALTGLPNRVLFEERARTAFQHRRRAQGFAVLLLDLDGFKEINDNLGHAAGDAVLREVARRLRRAVRPQDTVSRLGGDEFAVLLDDARAAEATASRLAGLLAEPMEAQSVFVSVGASIGLALYPDDAVSYEELLRRADVAMYQAKHAGIAFRRYNAEVDRELLNGLHVVDELQAALDNDEFEVHFQPEIDLRTGLAIGAEALVRWRHPRRGLLAPGSFLGALEKSCLLRQFTCMVLEKAVAECAGWLPAGRDLTVSVNLSARAFESGLLVEDVASVLARHCVPPARLVLEISETAVLTDLELVEEHISRLAALGVGVAIDDFGTGHLSLRALRRMRVSEVKLDRSFVAGIMSSAEASAVTEATVHLAHSLGLRTVAEGVEEPLVLERLTDLGCDCGQGYHWSRPVPASQIRALLGISPPISTGGGPVENGSEPQHDDVVR